jgi:hypothetical protein
MPVLGFTMTFQPFCPTPKAYVDFMRSKFSKLATLDKRECFIYLSLIYANVTGDKRYVHKLYDDCFAIDAALLKQRLGNDYLALMDNIALIHIAHSYSVEKNATRAYKLDDMAIAATLHYFVSHTEQTAFICAGGKPITVTKTNTAIRSKKNGNTTKCRAYINPIVTINIFELNRLIDTLNHDIKTATCEALKRRGIAAQKFVYEALHNNHKDLVQGQIIQHYIESPSGRLYGCVNHLQSTPREVREAALYGQANYDFENCHYSIFTQLCNRLGATTPAIDYYIANKKKLRAQLAATYGLTIKQVKECLLALIYGASLFYMGNEYSKYSTAIKDIVGAGIYEKLRNQKDFYNIAQEIKANTQLIIKQHSTKSGITNAVKKSLRPLSKYNNRQLLAHIIQGYEVQMLHIVLAKHGKEISLLQHDGFHSLNLHINIDALEKEIQMQTGFKMLISKELPKNNQKKGELAA